MSQDHDHHQERVYCSSNGFDRSVQQPILRDKFCGWTAPDENSGAGIPTAYETVGMLSEMFSYPAAHLLHQMGPPWFQDSRQPQPPGIQEWYSQKNDPNTHEFPDVVSSSDIVHLQRPHQISAVTSAANSTAAAMQLFLMNPTQRSSISSQGPASSTSHNNTLHMLLPNNPNSGGFEAWRGSGAAGGSGCDVQGRLYLSLASSLDAAKAEQFYFTQHCQQLQQQNPHFNHQMNNGIFVHRSTSSSSSLPVGNLLRNSKYAKPTQELLEEFCNVGRSHFKKNKVRNNYQPNLNNPNNNQTTATGSGGTAPPTLSAAERAEHQRKKVKLLAMLDEVDRRYNHYCEQMQIVVNSFDMVIGFGSAVPYTVLAQKAMSRHFRCLKDAITSQLKHSCELLGEKNAPAGSGVTKGETPRLRILEQNLRQERAFHQIGMMESEAWRPQRGLPERSVNMLRAWLFEHFLHPYPSDADKHLLARQTGLSRNQVSNWFINARVRLWKPMVEEMYQQEATEEVASENTDNNNKRIGYINDQDNLHDTSQRLHNSSQLYKASEPQVPNMVMPAADPQNYCQRLHVEMMAMDDPCRGDNGSSTGITTLPLNGGYIGGGPGLIRFGNNVAGDVSLTLGLRQHTGSNLPEKNPFSVRDFRS